MDQILWTLRCLRLALLWLLSVFKYGLELQENILSHQQNFKTTYAIDSIKLAPI